MKKRKKRILSLCLAALMTVSVFQMPASATGREAVVTESSVSRGTETEQLYGGTSIASKPIVLDGSAGYELGQDGIDFCNNMGVLGITTVFKYEHPESKKYALFTIQGENGDYITVWHDPLNNRLCFAHKGSTNAYHYTRSEFACNDTNWHKLSVLIDGTNLKIALDDKSLTLPAQVQYVNNFFQRTGFTATKVLIGGKATAGTYAYTDMNNFSGTIKYMKITGTTFDTSTENGVVAEGLKEELTTYMENDCGLTAGDYDSGKWNHFQAAIDEAAARTYTTEAAIYGAYDQLQTAVNVLNGVVDIETIGSSISEMFTVNGADNTWLFGGGAEVQGRAVELGGKRGYVRHFEEWIRYEGLVSSGGMTQINGQRFVINTAKAGERLRDFVEKLDGFITEIDPKAVAYMIGAEDYNQGDTGIEDFQTALGTLITKALDMRNNSGFAVIQLPHAVADASANAQAKLYADAAVEVVKNLNSELLNRVVVADHYSQTNNNDFKNGNNLTADGRLNANGSYKLAKLLADRTIGTSGFKAMTNFTETDLPENYINVLPRVMGDVNRLNVTMPKDAQANARWRYRISVRGVEITGLAQGNTFQINDLPADEGYELRIQSEDGSTQYNTVYGTVAAGVAGTEKVLTDLQQKLRTKLATRDSLTWLFVGDSITHACRHTYGYDGVANSIEKYIKEDLGRTDDVIINTGVSSATTTSTLANIENRITKYKADIVSVMLGTNDVYSINIANYNEAISVEQYKTNMRQIVAKIREANEDATVIFRTPTPCTNQDRSALPEYVAAMKEIAEEDGNILVVEQFTDWKAECTKYSYFYTSSFYFGDNSLHPGGAGQAYMTRTFIKDCGLEQNTRIGNLDYLLGYRDSTGTETVPTVAEDQSVSLSKSALQTAYGSTDTIGDVELMLTEASTGTTYKKMTAEDGNAVISNLPVGTYKVSATAIMTNAAKRVTFTGETAYLGTEKPKIIRISCVGDSLTFGYTSSNPATKAYPVKLQEILGDGYVVSNYGKSSKTMINDVRDSYTATQEYRNSLDSNPDIVIIMLGTNDSKLKYWNAVTFKEDALKLINTYRNLPSNPKIIFATSPACFLTNENDIRPSIISGELNALQKEIASEENLQMIDMYEKTTDRVDLYNADKVHFTDNGYQYLAECMYVAVKEAALKDKIAEAEELKAADYTAETWAAFQTALESAKAAAESQEEVEAAITVLTNAINGLKLQEDADREDARAYILELQDELKEMDMTKLDEAVYQAALDAYNNPKATAEELKTAANALADAIRKIREDEQIAAKEEAERAEAQQKVKTAVENAEAVITAGDAAYTSESWNTFVAAYQAAKNAPEGADSKILKGLAEKLETAYASLKKKEIPQETPSTDGSKPSTDSSKPSTDISIPGTDVSTPGKGEKKEIGNFLYQVTGTDTVEVLKLTKKGRKLKVLKMYNSVTLGKKTFKVTSIARNAFKGNKKITKVVIGKNIQKIGSKAFYGCKNVKKVVFKTKVLKNVGKAAFTSIHKKALVNVPKAKKTKYIKILKKGGVKVTKIK